MRGVPAATIATGMSRLSERFAVSQSKPNRVTERRTWRQMGKAIDNKIKDEALSDEEIDVCDDCGNEEAKSDIHSCRRCGVRLCDFCMDLHECDEDEYAVRPKKSLDKPRRM